MQIDTRAVIINLLKEDKKSYLSIKRLQRLLIYIYDELSMQFDLADYNICFDINFEAIERTVLYNNHLFKLDIDGDMIYLRDSTNIDNLANQYKICSIVANMIRHFSKIA